MLCCPEASLWAIKLEPMQPSQSGLTKFNTAEFDIQNVGAKEACLYVKEAFDLIFTRDF